MNLTNTTIINGAILVEKRHLTLTTHSNSTYLNTGCLNNDGKKSEDEQYIHEEDLNK